MATPRARGRPPHPDLPTPTTGLGRIGQVSLFIRDVTRAERFYGTTLGLPHVFTFGDLAFFDAAGTRLYLHRKDEAEWRPGSVLYFAVDDIHVAQESLASAGVRFTGAPHRIHTHDDGTEEWMTFFDDGEGNTLALMSSVPAAGS
jgi:predicted enzyme related to lactoylglutathione lyase